ncbi:MAG: PAS domain S-box protein, partial [Candidatus Thermoplasmatota archaeon]
MDILLVDDEKAFLDQAKIFLKKIDEELNIDTVTSPEKAFKKFEENDYELVVSDYQMPGTDGLEFLEELREERESEIPFIMFTGKGREEVAMEALNLGADRYLQKGGEPKNQYEVLAHAIEQEAEHRSTEKLLRLAKYSIEKANRGIFWITEEGKFTYVNETAAERLGYSKEELEGMHIWDIDPNHGEDIRGERWEKLKDEEVLTFETEHETKEGEIYPVEVTSHYLEFGGKEYEFAFVEDISERKEKESKLQETKDWLSQVVDGSSVPMFVIDDDHKVTHWNKACENLTGISKEEVVGTSDSWKAFYDEKRPLLADLILDDVSEEEIEEWYGDKFSQLSILDDAYEAEDFFPKMGEEGKWAFFTAAPLTDSDGKRVGAIETLHNITEREEQRQELKRKEKYLDHTPTYINVIDEEGNIKYHSYPSNEITGLDPSEFMGGEAIEFVHPEDREKTLEMFSKVMEDPGEEQTIELRGEAEDGWIWLEVRAVNYLDDPEINGIIVTAQDISGRKEMEKELKESEERFRSLFESSRDAVMTLKPPEWDFTSANPAAVEIFGAKDEDDFCSRSPWDYSPEKQ